MTVWGHARAVAVTLAVAATCGAADWGTTELQLQYGTLDLPYGGGDAATGTLTFQHAGGWPGGELYFFADLIDAAAPARERDIYAELYAAFSVVRAARRPLAAGPLRDVAVIAGLNWAANAEVVKLLPGVRLAWNVPGFAFLNTDVMAYIDESSGLAGGGAPREGDAFMLDVSWELPFAVKDLQMTLEGHAEWLTGRDDELGQRVHPWFLAQPQLRIDLGRALGGREKTIFVGVEWQLWINKLGDARTDENAVQALIVWRI